MNKDFSSSLSVTKETAYHLCVSESASSIGQTHSVDADIHLDACV